MVGTSSRQADTSDRGVFVRNLHFETTSANLESTFESVGPIKSCFIVTERGTGKSKGFGIVQYAEPDDAAEAVKQLDGKEIKGRPMHVERALRRDPTKRKRPSAKPQDDDITDGVPEPASNTGTTADASADAGDAGDNMIVDGPTFEGGTEGDAGGAAEETPAPAPKARRRNEINEPMKLCVIVQNLPLDVTAKVLYKRCRKLATISGQNGIQMGTHGEGTATVTFADEKEALKAEKKLAGKQLKGNKLEAVLGSKFRASQRKGKGSDAVKNPKSAKKFRLIVRNLPFTCTDTMLRKVCAKHGPMTELTLVRTDDGTKCKGFAFVQYRNANDAAMALKKVNGKKVGGRVVAVDWALSKSIYEQRKDTTDAESSQGQAEDGSDESADDSDDADESDAEGAAASVKMNKKKTAKEATSDDSENDDSDDSSDGMDEDADEDENATPSKDDGNNDNEEEKNDDEEEEEVDDDDESSDGEIEKSSDVGQGRTLFIRNVSFDTKDEDLAEVFAAFGDVEMCKIVRDEDTGRSRGTAFVKMATREQVSAVLERVESATDLGPVECSGRTLNIVQAVDRRDAANMANSNAQKREEEKANKVKDNRNLYLLRQGLIMNNTPAYAQLSSHDKALRRKLEMEAKAKITSPNLSVSKTRVSVHNMPLTLTEAELRKIVTGCCKLKGRLLQAKVVRSKDRLGPDGKLRSKGFGFLEFAEHDDALAVIQAMNNSPKYFDPKKRPILQFAWIDVQVIKKILRRREESRARVTQEKDGQDPTNPKKAKILRRIEKFKKKREQRRAEKQQGAAGGTTPTDTPSAAATTNATAPPTATAQPAKRRRTNKQLSASGNPSSAAPVATPTQNAPTSSRKRGGGEVGLAVLPTTTSEDVNERPTRGRKGKEKVKRAVAAFDNLVDKYRAKLTGAAQKAGKWA
eukprot:m.172890 g.172890  ORF g.172890 m.172890 type:complete len:920 (+) comp13603_c0_seq1:300-3059(+)